MLTLVSWLRHFHDLGLIMLVVCVCGAAGAAVLHFQRHARDARRTLRAAFRSAPSGLALFDADGRLLIWNGLFADLASLFAVRPFRHAAESEVGPEAWSAARSTQLAAPQGREHSRVHEIRTPDGRWFLHERHPLDNGGALVVLTDVSPMRAAAADLAEARDRAETASRAKSDFLANMTHEIRTPLNGVLGMAQVMEADTLTDAQRARVRVIRESGGALLGLFNDLLDLSNIQAGHLELATQPTDIAYLARQAASAFQDEARCKGLALTMDIDPAAEGYWAADGDRLLQMLDKLVGNAVRYTERGEVTLSVSAGVSGLVLRVRDTGPGIAPDRQAGLFETFAQGDSSLNRRYGGTGLGLSICREMARLMGGAIEVASRPGDGACFTLTLPLARMAPPLLKTTPTGTGETPETSLRILAAEDNLTNQLVLRSLLEAANCEVVFAMNGLEALAEWSAGGFDLILMDVQMPVMNGIEATREIRRQAAERGLARIPIVALSSNTMSHQVRDYVEAGMDDWVAKPIEVRKLYDVLEATLRPSPEARAA